MIKWSSLQGTVGVLIVNPETGRWQVTALGPETEVSDIFHNGRDEWGYGIVPIPDEVALVGRRVLLVLMEWFTRPSGHLRGRLPFSCSTIKVNDIEISKASDIPHNRGLTELTVEFELPPKMATLRTLLWYLYLPETDRDQLPYWVRETRYHLGDYEHEKEKVGELKAALRLKIRDIVNDCVWSLAREEKRVLACQKEALLEGEALANEAEFEQWNLFDSV